MPLARLGNPDSGANQRPRAESQVVSRTPGSDQAFAALRPSPARIGMPPTRVIGAVSVTSAIRSASPAQPTEVRTGRWRLPSLRGRRRSRPSGVLRNSALVPLKHSWRAQSSDAAATPTSADLTGKRLRLSTSITPETPAAEKPQRDPVEGRPLTPVTLFVARRTDCD